MERFFAQHIRHGAAERSERGILQHLQLKLSIAVDEVGVSEEIHPVINIDVECAEQPLVIEGAALEHLLGFDLARITKVIHQQRAHLPTVAHLFNHHAGERAPIPVGRSGLEQFALLLHAGKFGIALIDDQID